MDCVSMLRIIVGQEGEYVAQLIGTHPNDYDGQEYLEKIVIVQLEIIFQSQPIARVCFFQQMGAHNFRLAGRWLYYGFYQFLVLTLGRVLLTADRSGHRLGAF